MKYNLENIHNKHKNSVGITMAHGPSLGPYLEQFNDLCKDKQENNHLFFSCGEPDKIFENLNMNFDLDYWVLANSCVLIENSYSRFNNCKNTTIVYADSVDLTEEPEKLLTGNYLPYDQRHFQGKTCLENHGHIGQVHGKSCCDFKSNDRKNGNLTIQEFLQKISGHKNHYSPGDTSALHMLSLAVITGCNPIFICGVDLDYSKGYVDQKTINNDSFDPYMMNILNDFKIINESAEKLGIKIYNLSPQSELHKVIETPKTDE